MAFDHREQTLSPGLPYESTVATITVLRQGHIYSRRSFVREAVINALGELFKE